MKIAISAAGHDLDAQVDPRFGRCMYFIIADPDNGEFETVNNDSAMASGGAGISAAQMIAERGVTAVLTGNCGPNAYQTLSAAGVEVITGVSGRIRDIMNNYKAGQYNAAIQHNVPDHFGMASVPDASGPIAGQQPRQGMGGGAGRGMGRGMGMSGGMGGGAGRGMGRGMGMGQTTGGDSDNIGGEQQIGGMATSARGKKEELEILKSEAEFMAKRLSEIQQHIEEIENQK